MMKHLFRTLLRAAAVVALVAATAGPALAGPVINPTGGTSVSASDLKTLPAITQTIFSIITTVAVVVFVILLLVGGIQYLASFGNEEATTKAKKLIVDAVVGLFIVLAAAGIANFVFNQLGVTGYQQLFLGNVIQ